MLAQMERMDRRLQCIEGKLDSNASFYPLMAMAQLDQQTHALAQYITVGYRSSAAPLSPAVSPRAATVTPDKKRLARQSNARELAKKQVANVQQRMDQQGQTSMPSGAPIDDVQAPSARAVLSRPPLNGVQVVYPGSAGGAYWCKWEGRCVLGLLSMLLLLHMCSAYKRHACRFATRGQYPTWKLLMRE